MKVSSFEGPSDFGVTTRGGAVQAAISFRCDSVSATHEAVGGTAQGPARDAEHRAEALRARGQIKRQDERAKGSPEA